VCKVEGIFPEEEQICDAPLGLLSPSMGIHHVEKGGKECMSRFRRLHINEAEGTSIVHCLISTGRTHQIRIHLQYLGFPIIDDKLYNDIVWGPTKGKLGEYGKPLNQLRHDVQDRHKASLWVTREHNGYSAKMKELADSEKVVPEVIAFNNLQLDARPAYDPICLGCNVEKKTPDMSHFRISLHCWRYKSESFEFEAPLPGWAVNEEEEVEEPVPVKVPRIGEE